jgi:hypothetical protein
MEVIRQPIRIWAEVTYAEGGRQARDRKQNAAGTWEQDYVSGLDIKPAIKYIHYAA